MKKERMREGERTMLRLRQLKAILNELEPRLALASVLQGSACQIISPGVLGWWSVGVHCSLLGAKDERPSPQCELGQWGSPLKMRLCQESSH